MTFNAVYVHRPRLRHDDYLLRLFFTKTPAVPFIIQVSCNWLTFQNDTDGQKPMTRAMVAVEMHWLNHNGLMEFRDAPQLQVVSAAVTSRSAVTSRLADYVPRCFCSLFGNTLTVYLCNIIRVHFEFSQQSLSRTSA